jgi:beta-lactamase regulating signal transducer with metallopeptidase domain
VIPLEGVWPSYPHALVIVVKSTLLLSAGALAALLARRGSAAVRHAIWAATLAALVVLPLLTVTLPRWSVPFGNAAVVLSASGRGDPRAPVPGGAAAGRYGAAGLSRGGGSEGRSGVERLAASVWLAGVLASLALVAGGALLRGHLRLRGAGVEPAGRWGESLRQAAAELGVHRRVVLLRSPHGGVPATWGVLRPVIVIPAACDEWSRERRRTLLLHELCHVQRLDAGALIIAQLARSLFWFHPLAWYAARRLVVEQERACDDAVLRAGTPSHSYAADLLAIADEFRTATLLGVGLAAARPSQLEGRMLAILDPQLRRAPLSFAARRTVAALALGLAGALGAATPAPGTPGAAVADVEVEDRGRLKLEWEENGARMTAIVRGPVRFGRGVDGLVVPRGGLLLVEEWRGGIPRRRLVAEGRASLGWTVEGRRAPLDSDSRAWLSSVLDYVRESVELAAEARRLAEAREALATGGEAMSSEAPSPALQRRLLDVAARRERALAASGDLAFSARERLEWERQWYVLGWEELRLVHGGAGTRLPLGSGSGSPPR